jgi:hypothetical protein
MIIRAASHRIGGRLLKKARASGHLPRTEPGSEGTIWQCVDSIWLE